MSRPWRGDEALLLGHSQMEGLAPHLRSFLLRDGARVVHVRTERGSNVRRLRREVEAGNRLLPRSTADRIPFVIVALSGNGAVTAPLELGANLDWIRAELPRASIVWLGHTVTRTGTEADQERAYAAELERRVVPAREGFVFVDMRVPDVELAADGVHFTSDGYTRLAEHVWSRVVEAHTEPRARVWLPLVLGLGLGLLGVLGFRHLTSEREA